VAEDVKEVGMAEDVKEIGMAESERQEGTGMLEWLRRRSA
jgi:hypothetical protein